MSRGHNANAVNGMSVRRSRQVWTPERRAKQLAIIEERSRARDAANPLTPYRTLFWLANPAAFTLIGSVGGVLSDYHRLVRRAHVLRAWCAQKLGWRGVRDEELALAKHHRDCERGFRKVGR